MTKFDATKLRKSFKVDEHVGKDGRVVPGVDMTHDQALAELGMVSHKVTEVVLPCEDPMNGRTRGTVKYEVDDGSLGRWKAEAKRLAKENAELRRKLELQSPDDERLAEERLWRARLARRNAR
jgi:hypothetical protein